MQKSIDKSRNMIYNKVTIKKGANLFHKSTSTYGVLVHRSARTQMVTNCKSGRMQEFLSKDFSPKSFGTEREDYLARLKFQIGKFPGKSFTDEQKFK